MRRCCEGTRSGPQIALTHIGTLERDEPLRPADQADLSLPLQRLPSRHRRTKHPTTHSLKMHQLAVGSLQRHTRMIVSKWGRL
ncbi:hypothetical protein CHELA40_40121 [Chelatococcus asaccharovorans]|nr:hypothetical protein CHELA17_50073 [Chelatococcus asaccharovorans]CAH1689881.1 hypothetical protein CHELA40_40121 [Chelatococcus asaccharovorans]